MGIIRKDKNDSESSPSDESSVDRSVSGRKWKYYSRQPGTLADLNFVSVEEAKRKAIILLIGDDGAGKTSFATRYAPEPLVVISFDGRSRNAVKEAREELGRNVELIEKSITHKNLPPEDMKLHAREVVEDTMFTFETLLEESKRGNVKSILWDTATEYTEILKLAFDGTVDKTKEGAKGVDLNFADRQWWRMFNLIREEQFNAHLIVTSRMSSVWRDDKDTGLFKPRCSRAVRSGVDLEMRIKLKTVFNVPKPEFEIEVTNPKTNITEMGEVYDASKWDKLGGPFVYACCMNYKDSVPDDWE